jgi:transposase
MSKHSVPASDVSGLLRRFAKLRRKAAARTGRDFPIIVIQEAGLDGFWIHRVLLQRREQSRWKPTPYYRGQRRESQAIQLHGGR